MRDRDGSYRRYWRRLVDQWGPLCAYCRDDIATCIDHINPYSYSYDNSYENLAPCCDWCNLHAGDKVFADFYAKRDWLLKTRKTKLKDGSQRTVCVGCLLPYQRPLHSPSLLYCAECYTDENNTNYARRKAWQEWLELLEQAKIPVEVHRILKKVKTRDMQSKKLTLAALLENYYAQEFEFSR